MTMPKNWLIVGLSFLVVRGRIAAMLARMHATKNPPVGTGGFFFGAGRISA
ncbi:hypothetical protein [Azospira restricta]|uniref:Uncharacterized protein n=1 Tax=Azospira restricta TaxID=404405 RepID=A0A974SSS6_9RHOO|nr:hypothetical protein [Azospira restricta]QRJ65812.1 hypothetical protein IWH25_12850 [Azospira restricta]